VTGRILDIAAAGERADRDSHRVGINELIEQFSHLVRVDAGT
jgi:hypothetical protein